MSTVLVTGGTERSTLAVVRSLGRAGHEVHVAAIRRPCLSGASRYVAGASSVPDALEHPEAFARDVAARVEEVGAELLLPVTDPDLLAVLRHRSWFGDATVPTPSLETVEAVADKALVTERARSLGLHVPEQVHLSGPGNLPGVQAATTRYPLVVKPGRSVVDDGGGLTKTFVRYAEGPHELQSLVAPLPETAFPVLLQERIRGDGVGVFLLLWNGELLAAFAHRRIREKPPSGGVSVLRESIPLPDDLLDRSRRLLESFGWQGVAMIEYKREAPGGRHVLMEINGRFWGSLQLAVDAGVDFPRLLVDAASGQSVEPVLDYRTGVRCRWFWGDVDHLLARMRHSRERLDLPADAPGRLRTVVDFFRSFRPSTRNEVFRWRDPGPALRETLDWVAGRG